MNQGILQWNPSSKSPFPLSSSFPSPIQFIPKFKRLNLISATLNSLEEEQKLPAKERRKLRNERRESKAFDWKEEVEMRLIKKPKKRYASWTEELNLDTLAQLGPQWWVTRVARVNGHETAEKLARSLANNYPDIDFKVIPGYITRPVELNLLCRVFRKRQINKPRPVSEDDMEKIFRQAKEEQEKADQAFEDGQKPVLSSEVPQLESESGSLETLIDSSPKRRTTKTSESTPKGKKKKIPKIGSTVRVVSGSFAEFSGILKKVDKKNEKVTVGFTLFGKETIADLDFKEIAEEAV
uniref:KOW domain-containing protein n=1 Tax=Chenopodium quinoa TaxID=63459 RepID=A0A803M0F3_CHEQI